MGKLIGDLGVGLVKKSGQGKRPPRQISGYIKYIIHSNHPFHLEYHSSTAPIAAIMTITMIKPRRILHFQQPTDVHPSRPAIRLKGSLEP